MPVGNKWTDEQQKQLEELHRQGLTSSQIGAEFGRSRNSVIGRLMRSGLTEKGYKEGYRSRPSPTERSKVQKQRMFAKGERARRQKSYVTAALEVVAHMEACHPTKMRLCSLVDLKSNSCRFPIGDPTTPDFAYCGNDAMQLMPYCGHHTRMAYSPPVTRKSRREAYYGPKV